MTCAQAEGHLLDSIDEPLAAAEQRAVDLHLSSCDGCREFAAQLHAVDAQLSLALPPVTAPASIADAVHRQQRDDKRAALRDSLPDVIHLTGCAAATILSAAFLPVEAPVTVAAGIAFTCFTYLVMAIVRSSLDAVEQPDW
jgi:hypothetical protein